MERPRYIKLVFNRGSTRAYAMLPLDPHGFSLHGRVQRIDNLPLTATAPGDCLRFDDEIVEVVEIAFPDEPPQDPANAGGIH